MIISGFLRSSGHFLGGGVQQRRSFRIGSGRDCHVRFVGPGGRQRGNGHRGPDGRRASFRDRLRGHERRGGLDFRDLPQRGPRLLAVRLNLLRGVERRDGHELRREDAAGRRGGRGGRKFRHAPGLALPQPREIVQKLMRVLPELRVNLHRDH